MEELFRAYVHKDSSVVTVGDPVEGSVSDSFDHCDNVGGAEYRVYAL